MDNHYKQEVAKIIIQQLGGGRFKVMTGAKQWAIPTGEKPGVEFRLPSDSNFVKDGINYVKILLNGRDLYDIKFGRIWGMKYNILKTMEDIYCEDLQELFTETTGLHTHL